MEDVHYVSIPKMGYAIFGPQQNWIVFLALLNNVFISWGYDL